MDATDLMGLVVLRNVEAYLGDQYWEPIALDDSNMERAVHDALGIVRTFQHDLVVGARRCWAGYFATEPDSRGVGTRAIAYTSHKLK